MNINTQIKYWAKLVKESQDVNKEHEDEGDYNSPSDNGEDNSKKDVDNSKDDSQITVKDALKVFGNSGFGSEFLQVIGKDGKKYAGSDFWSVDSNDVHKGFAIHIHNTKHNPKESGVLTPDDMRYRLKGADKNGYGDIKLLAYTDPALNKDSLSPIVEIKKDGKFFTVICLNTKNVQVNENVINEDENFSDILMKLVKEISKNLNISYKDLDNKVYETVQQIAKNNKMEFMEALDLLNKAWKKRNDAEYQAFMKAIENGGNSREATVFKSREQKEAFGKIGDSIWACATKEPKQDKGDQQ